MMPRIDKLMWGIAADALSVVVTQVSTLVAASAVHPEAAELARERIGHLRAFGYGLLRQADDLEATMNKEGSLPDLHEIADDFAHHMFRGDLEGEA
jgi:hypothetical protein